MHFLKCRPVVLSIIVLVIWMSQDLQASDAGYHVNTYTYDPKTSIILRGISWIAYIAFKLLIMKKLALFGLFLFKHKSKYLLFGKRSIDVPMDGLPKFDNPDDYISLVASIDEDTCIARLVCEAMIDEKKASAFTKTMSLFYSFPESLSSIDSPGARYSYAAEVGKNFKSSDACQRAFSKCAKSIEELRPIADAVFSDIDIPTKL